MRELPEYLGTKGDGSKIYSCDKACRPHGAGFKAMTDEEARTMFPNSPVDLAKFKVYHFEIANTKRDRHRDEFTLPVLQKFNAQINSGEVVNLFNHDHSMPTGRALKAYMDGESLKGYIAIHKSARLPMQPDITITEAIDSGILKDVSVGFGGVKYTAVETTDYNSPTAWRIEDDTNHPTGAELREISIVSKGAQIGATLKSADGGNKEKPNNTMSKGYETLVLGGGKFTINIKADGDTLRCDADDVKRVETAYNSVAEELAKTKSETTTLKAEIDALKASEAKAREPFTADIINFQKAAGIPDSAIYTDESLKAMPFDKLVALSREIVQKADQAGGVQPSDTKTKKAYNLDY